MTASKDSMPRGCRACTGSEDMPIEVEAKLLVSGRRDLDVIAARNKIAGFHTGQLERQRLYSVYIDTRRLALARHGIALRLRRHRRQWELTVKWGGRVEGFVHSRPEENVLLGHRPQFPFSIPYGPLRKRLAPLLGRSLLRPILITDIDRRRRQLLAGSCALRAHPVAELALDIVHLRHPAEPRPRLTYCEIEIELLHGNRHQLRELVDALAGLVTLTPSPASKFACGLALFYPRFTSRMRQQGAAVA